MKKRTLIYLVVLITMINVSALGTMLYLRWQASLPCQSGTGFDQVKKDVGLSAKQEQQFQVYRKRFHAELDSMDQRLAYERRKLANEIRQSEPDSARIREIIQHIGRLQQESQYRIIDHFFQIKKILEPEQQETFFNIVLERFVKRRQLPGARQSVHQNE